MGIPVMLLYIISYIPLCTSVRNSNTSCYDIYKMDSGNMDRMTCTGEHIVYHCIPNEKDQEVEICVQWKWITPGYCPYYDSTSNAIKETQCSLYCLRRDDLEEICICSSRNTENTSCKTECGKDFTSYKYIFCEVEVFPTVARSVSTTLPTRSVTYQKERKRYRSLGSVIGIALGVLIPIILAAVAILLIYRKKIQYCRKGNTEISQHTLDIEGQPSEREQLLDGNKQDTEQKLVEYIKEDATSSTPLIDNKNENNTNDLKQENEISPKISELNDSQQGSSSPKSGKGLVQEIPGNHTNECSNTESPLENVQLISPSEPPVQTDDLSNAGVEGKEKVSNESGEKEGSSPMPDTEETIKSESIKEDENQSKGKGNESKNLTLHAGNTGENYSSSEPVISTSTNQTLISASNNEDKSPENGNKKLDCISSGSGEEQSHSFEHKPDGGNITSSQTESTDGNISSVQKNHGNGDVVKVSVHLTDLSVDQDGNSNTCKPNSLGIVEKDLYKPSVEGEIEVEVVNAYESEEKKGSSDHIEEKTEMESIEEDNHQSERKGNEDNEEDTSIEKEYTVGVFDDTLESIKKEDDAEKGGSVELQDFLQVVSTRLTKKMLFHVLKKYVTDPQSYLTDESKETLVKKLLPTEYQKAVSIDSDDKKSIAVIYAILQLSLEKEHRPKSGWGQGVKDTDIGVGDDVERLYRVHTLYRDIADPEQISLTGYTRLFKVLFEAVDRLDKKGKCKEDYQEFVKRWENLQKNQWYKDNLNALWSVIQKWSL